MKICCLFGKRTIRLNDGLIIEDVKTLNKLSFIGRFAIKNIWFEKTKIIGFNGFILSRFL